MENFPKIFLINLMVMIAYMTGIHLIGSMGVSSVSDRMIGVLILSVVALIIQGLVNIIIMIVMFGMGKKGSGFSFLLTLFIIGVTGILVCFGNMYSMEWYR